MKNVRSLLAAVLLTSAALSGAAEPEANFAGKWQGTLEVGGTKLHVAFNISQPAENKLTATMDSPDQGVRGILVDSVVATGRSLRLEVKQVHGVYEGKLDAAGNTIAGNWTQGKPVPLTVTRATGAEAGSDAEELSPADLAASKEAAQKILGTWNGTMEVGGMSLRLRLSFAKAGTGAATGKMDSLDQGASGIPLSAITLKEGKVRFEVRGFAAVYEGTLAADGTTLNGQWQQGGQNLPLDFQKAKPE